MKYYIVLQEGWMGDTLWACNVIKNLSDMGHEIAFSHNWPFMKKLIDLFDINQNPTGLNLEDYKIIKYTHRLDHYENPLLDYANFFNIEGADLSLASKFYPIDKKLQETYPTSLPDKPYITYDIDWQLRTQRNTGYILEELKKEIDVVPIGGSRFTDDPQPLIESCKTLLHSKLHLGIVGGTTHLATFMNVKCICLSDHLYGVFANGKTPEDFLETFKPFPNYWADPKHIVTHPFINEDDYIQTIKNNLI